MLGFENGQFVREPDGAPGVRGSDLAARYQTAMHQGLERAERGPSALTMVHWAEIFT